MRVTVVGLGYVGLVTGACVAAWDHDVVGVDSDKGRLGSLRAGTLPFHEPDLDRLVADGAARGRLAFTDDLAGAASTADIVIIAVGTHDGNGGWQTDTIRACLAQVVPAMRDDATLVIRSTLPPDMVRSVRGLVDGHRAAAGRRPIPAMLNPEFTREGRAVHDYQNPERIVFGVVTDPDGRGEAALREMYRSAAAPVLVMSAIDAALTKLGANLFLATKISFANELADLCDAYDADVSTVVDGMSYDGRIGGSFLRAGVGFGGSCLPNQVAMTIRTATGIGVDVPLLSAVAEVNGRRRERVVERAAMLLDGTVRHRRVTLLGLTFKPDTDDLRDAPALDIARGLIEAGASVVAYDPMPTARARSATLVPGLQIAEDPYDALVGADAAILVTEWREFLDLDWSAAAAVMRRRVVIDGRNQLPGARLAEAGFTYASFGRGTLEPTPVDTAQVAAPLGMSLGWGEGMTRPVRPQLTLAAAGTVLGIGLGVVAATIVPGLDGVIGALAAVIGATAVVAIVLATTWPASAESAADDTAWTEFRRELRRARRSGRPLTLLRIPMPEPVSSDVPGAATLVRAIGAELRLIDRTWVDGDSIYLMLPESSRSAATVVVDRLAATPATVAVGAAHMATFPEDGLTSGALLAAVHGTAVGQVPIPLRPSLDESSIRSVEADAALGGAAGPR